MPRDDAKSRFNPNGAEPGDKRKPYIRDDEDVRHEYRPKRLINRLSQYDPKTGDQKPGSQNPRKR